MINTANLTLRKKIVFLAYIGCRFGELRGLQWVDLEFDIGEHGFVTIRRGGSGADSKEHVGVYSMVEALDVAAAI